MAHTPKRPGGNNTNPYAKLAGELARFDWPACTEAVAADIFGECNEQLSRPPENVRFGNHGSMKIDYTKGIWYDFENEQGGGIHELIRIHKGIEDNKEIIAYAKKCMNGDADDDATVVEPAPSNGGTEPTPEPARPNGGAEPRSAKSHSDAKMELDKTFSYCDENGRIAFQTCRYVFRKADGALDIGANGKPKKTILQQRPSGEPDGSWIWSINPGEFMRTGPGQDWKTFYEAKYKKYPSTKQSKIFDSSAPVLPYKLPELKQALAAGQTIYIVEGEPKVHRLNELGFAATCNAAGAGKWTSEHSAYLKDADVVLLPDNDEAGRDHVAKAAESLQPVAKRVRILELPDLPEKGDIVDWKGDAKELARLTADAKDFVRDPNSGPQPLMRPMSKPEPFPVDALGPKLGNAARGIAAIVQAPIEMCASAVLGSASLAVSAHIDVELPTGEVKPTSLFLCSVAESGERKTTVDGYAFAAQQQWEQKLRANRVAELEIFRVNHASWDSKSKAIAKEYNKIGEAGSEAHQEELRQLGPEPAAPLPLLMSADFTFEGMVRCLNIGQPLFGIIGGEGGQFVGGHGMTDDARQRTLANLNDAWGGEKPIKRVRAGEAIILPGRRVGMHLGMQPIVAQKLLTDNQAKELGFLGRILMSWPESLIGTRFYKEPPLQAKQDVVDFTTRVLAILETPYPLAEKSRNELDPRPLSFSTEATELYRKFANETEKTIARNGEYESITPFAAKLAEHAARIAATITGYCDLHASEIGREDFLRGIHIASYYANEAKRIAESGLADPGLMMAQKLLDWLSEWSKPTIQAREIYTLGPNAIRVRGTALAAAEILVEHGWLKPMKTKRVDQNEWQIIGKQEQ